MALRLVGANGNRHPQSLSAALLRLLNCAALLTARRALSRAALSTVSLRHALDRATSSSVSTVPCTFDVAAPRTQPRRALSTTPRARKHDARSQPHCALNVPCVLVHSCARSQLCSLSLPDGNTRTLLALAQHHRRTHGCCSHCCVQARGPELGLPRARTCPVTNISPVSQSHI